MTLRNLVVLLSTLAAFPLVLADPFTFGTPDFTCQVPQEWRLHDYAPPASNDVIYGVRDGNLEECSNASWVGPQYGWHVLAEEECTQLRTTLDVTNPTYLLLCRTDGPADFDGDSEFALGGAILVASSGDGVTSGGIACFGIVGHHPVGGLVTVVDLFWGSQVPFSIAVDYTNPLNPVPSNEVDCGDGTIQPCNVGGSGSAPSATLPPPLGDVVEIVNQILLGGNNAICTPGDALVSCPIQNNGSCAASFPPGADGAYHIFVGRQLRPATFGHVYL